MKMQQQQLPLHLHQPRSDNPAAMSTFNQVSLDKSKSFIKALQELKNLRPQLYSAAEYCEKSYLNSEQKQMVLDNLKDYALRALVNAVDHLGTVAYKLTDVLEQQTVDISTMELKVSCVNQQLLTSQTYMNKEGLRQQELLAIIPRHHKHYTLPNIVNKKVHFGPLIHTNSRQNQNHSKLRLQPSATPAAKTLSWHLASETKSTLKGSSRASIRMDMDGSKSSGKSPGVFHLWDGKESTRNKHPAVHLQLTGGGSASSASMLTSSVTPKHSSPEGNKHMTPFRSFGSPIPREIARAPVRSKSMMSAFFAKQKTQKLKTSAVS